MKNIQKFCVLMNEKARELNMTDSVFNDPAGIDNYSTSRDILNCLIKAHENKLISDIWGQERDRILIKGQNAREMSFDSITFNGPNNRILRDYYTLICGKGGTLNTPKIFNLAAIVKTHDDGREIACVIMNADDPSSGENNRYKATKQALDIALDIDYKQSDICAKSSIVCDISSGEILYEKNSKEVIKPASMSKMLTAILISEYAKDINADVCVKKDVLDKIPGKFYQNDFHEGDIVMVRDLVSAMFLPSSNAAAYILGDYIGQIL